MHIPQQSLFHGSIIVHQIGLSLIVRKKTKLFFGHKFHKIDSKTNLFLFRNMSLEVLPMLKETEEENRDDSILHHH